MQKKHVGPKILLLDVETAPILASVWGLWDNNVALNQIVKDWHLLSWSAKWLHEDKIMYKDQRGKRRLEDDKQLMLGIAKLIDEADIVITHNGIKFDRKKINARLAKHGIKPPANPKNIDTLKIAKKHFAFTSNKLEYLAKYLGVKVTKYEHKEFPGQDLWNECLKDNLKAWKVMQKYNETDVITLENVYKALIPWEPNINFGIYQSTNHKVCTCGSTLFQPRGFAYTTRGKFKRFTCKSCGAWSQDKQNLYKEKIVKIQTR